MKASANSNRFSEFPIDIENLFDHFFGNTNPTPPTSGWKPVTDVTENETGYHVVMELPGVIADDVTIEMKDKQLVIQGTKTVAQPTDGERRARSERRSGDFRRSFEFASLVDADAISAEFKSGLLSIELPKSEKVLPRKIQIKTAE